MFCTQCGTNNADNAVVCMQCGRNLQAAVPPPAPPPIPPAFPSSVPPAALPASGVVLPPGVTVQNYLVFAILATLFCCLPAGIPAIVYAAQVNGKLQAGDLAGAQAASKNAKLWCIISAGLCVAVAFVYGIIMLIGILFGVTHTN
jgi:hypothetical protein